MLKKFDLYPKPSKKDLLTYSNQLRIEISQGIDIDELPCLSGKIQKNRKILSLQGHWKRSIKEREQDQKTLQRILLSDMERLSIMKRTPMTVIAKQSSTRLG